MNTIFKIKNNFRLLALIVFIVSIIVGGCNSKNKSKSLISADIIIEHAQVLTMDSNHTIFHNASVVIKQGRIVDIGFSDSIALKYIASRIIDGKNKLVMPGLVNTHTHVPMNLFRGYSDDQPLHDWLYKYIFPLEKKYVNAHSVRLGAQLAMIEMLKSGTTMFNDMYYYEDEVAKAAKEIGMRGIVCEGLISFPVPNARDYKEGIAYIEKLIKKWKGDSLITVGVSVHSPYTCSSQLIKDAWALANKYKIPFNIHLAETKWEVDSIMKTFHCTPVQYLQKLGALSENVIAAHCVHLSDEDIAILAKTKTGVAHNPECNMKICSGVAPVPAMIKKGVKVGLGTDGAASNNNLDMFQAMYTASLLHKLSSNDPTAMNAQQVVDMATINGAKVLGMDKLIGSLEKGKAADIIIIDLKRPEVYPLYNNIYSSIVYSMNSSAVNTVIINGKVVMDNRKILNIDEDKLLDDVQNLADSIAKTNKVVK
jgi:5-methylthioadenosine/S-adenosylhomocysteine deaminase